MAQELPVIVAGGGIGGLATALALVRQGFQVQVLEQALVPERSALLVPVPLLGRSVLEPALVPVPVLVLELQLARAPLALVPQLA